jgi:hypothetical protein
MNCKEQSDISAHPLDEGPTETPSINLPCLFGGGSWAVRGETFRLLLLWCGKDIAFSRGKGGSVRQML